ncbi:MAG: ROK family protein [Planctomycetes bacterium]|nr:ROK family protein [Planctomycetota bacterium]
MNELLHAGIDLGGTNVKIVLVTADGIVHAREIVPTRASDPPHTTVERVASAIRRLTGGRRLAGAGLGCAGALDLEAGVVVESPNLPAWNGAPARRLFAELLGVPVEFDNDANCAALGEHWLGAGRGASSLVALTLGTGIGGGIVLGGRVWRGATGTAGEIGHVTIAPDTGPICGCGSRGCVETLASATAIVREVARRLAAGERSMLAGREPTAREAAEAARAGDALARSVFDEAGRHLGIALALLANLLNPERAVLCGGLAGAWDILEAAARAALRRHAFARPAGTLDIRTGELGEFSGALGAARMTVLGGSGTT